MEPTRTIVPEAVRAVFPVATVIWLLALLGWLALLGVEALTLGPLGCELVPGSSIYGDATWSWLPPGTSCAWNLAAIGGPDLIVEQGPPAARLVTLGVFVAWGASLAAIKMSEARRTRATMGDVK